MKKFIVILILSFIILTGCENANSKSTYEIIQDDYGVEITVDEDTCVEYIFNFKYGASVRYNADGTLKLNNECINKGDK